MVVVPETGIEPVYPKVSVLKTGAYTNFATPALFRFLVLHLNMFST